MIDNDIVPYTLKENHELFNSYVEDNNYKILLQFSEKLFTEEFVKSHLEKIKEAIEVIDNNIIPSELKNNHELFNSYVNEDNYVMAFKFSKELVTDEFIKNHFEKIKKTINNGNTTIELMSNQTLFDLFIAENNYKIALNFSKIQVTDKFIREHLEKIKETICNNKYIQYNLENNKTLFNSYVNEGNYLMAFKFSKELFTDEFIKKHFEWIKITIDNGDIPGFLINNKMLFNSYVNEGNYLMAFKFSKELVTDEFIKSHLEEIKKSISDGDIPYRLQQNQELFNLYAAENNYTMAFKFSKETITEEFIKSHLEEIKNSISDGDIPYQLHHSQELFNSYVNDSNYQMAILFSKELVTDEFIKTHISEIKAVIGNDIDVIPYSLLTNQELFNSYMNDNNYQILFKFAPVLINKFANSCIKNEEYEILSKISYYYFRITKESADYILKKCSEGDCRLIKLFGKLINHKVVYKEIYEKNQCNVLPYILIDPKIIDDKNILRIYSETLKIDSEELKQMIGELYNKNDEICDTLTAGFLNKYKDIPKEEYQKFALYPDMQQMIINLDEKSFALLKKVLLNTTQHSGEYDICPTIYKAITNFPDYDELIKSINPDELDEKSITNLMYVLQKKTNLFGINSQEDICNFEQKRNDYFVNINKKIEDGKIDIASLRDALLEKKYGLSSEMAKFIIERYCSNLSDLKEYANDDDKRSISSDTYNLLANITEIYQSNNLDKLVYLYRNAPRVETDFATLSMLESGIRKKYANMFSDSLYKVKDEHKLANADIENKDTYDLLNSAEYNGNKPQIYIVDGDFNMQIHALGAYRPFERPDNFKQDWERPKISFHGICTSYIRNDEIATARNRNPVYGFDNYEDGALLCAGPYDLYSDPSIQNYAASIVEPYSFLPPNEMIDKTRHTHNELVIERLNGKDKRLPSYVVYFVDDINNPDNFKKENELFDGTIQAAVDQNIPLVIVDRLKYAKSEKAKCEQLKKEFFETMDINIFKTLITKFCNNMVGCTHFDNTPTQEYHKLFSIEAQNELLNEIYKFISEKDKNINNDYVNNIMTILNKEHIYSPIIPLLENLLKKRDEGIDENNRSR